MNNYAEEIDNYSVEDVIRIGKYLIMVHTKDIMDVYYELISWSSQLRLRIEQDGKVEVLPGLYLHSKENIMREQVNWEASHYCYMFDFSESPYWIVGNIEGQNYLGMIPYEI